MNWSWRTEAPLESPSAGGVAPIAAAHRLRPVPSSPSLVVRHPSIRQHAPGQSLSAGPEARWWTRAPTSWSWRMKAPLESRKQTSARRGLRPVCVVQRPLQACAAEDMEAAVAVEVRSR
jgi:hypothetical protein